MSTRLAVFAAAFALTSPALLPPAGASAVACVPGHNTVIPPCTYDSGLLSLDGYSPASGTEVTGGGGHHTVVSFPSSSFGAGIQAAADVGYPPFSATDSGGTSASGTLTIDLSATGGSAQIKKLRFVLINPQVTGAGSLSWSFTTVTPPGTVSGNQTVSSGDLIFASPVASVSPTLSVSLSTGGSGSATFDGYAVYVPEPNGLVMLCAGALALWALSRRRST
ncbi:MAG: PEP-CTERM sorting domain-containing protein [Deltaproteobacteria bacterium]|nr:MAG: PEP-CTERM sorting domain-containing protein [Deltaproteobacteria bacterium]